MRKPVCSPFFSVKVESQLTPCAENDNLRHEYVSLFSQTLKSIPFARIALEKEPDAINMWIGNSHSTTAMHRDNYENIYVQVAGQKHFVLLPAVCQPCINEQELSPASYARKGDDLVLHMEEDDAEKVPFAIWNPDRPHAHTTKYSHLAEPMRVTLNPGDMLYLPAMWLVHGGEMLLISDLCWLT